jgi:hypothetical protein
MIQTLTDPTAETSAKKRRCFDEIREVVKVSESKNRTISNMLNILQSTTLFFLSFAGV